MDRMQDRKIFHRDLAAAWSLAGVKTQRDSQQVLQESWVRVKDEERDPGLHADVHTETLSQRSLYCADPSLVQSLNVLAPGWSVEDIPYLYMENDRGLLAFDDSWTLYHWMKRWQMVSSSLPERPVVILHLDDHQDLVAPLLIRTEDPTHYLDPVTKMKVSWSDPVSVMRAVTSGAIGIGCFIAPCLDLWPGMTLLHLQREVAQTDEFWMSRTWEKDERLGEGVERPAVQRNPTGDPASAARYVRSSSLVELLGYIPANARVLLHIDLDYFNDALGGGRPNHRRQPDPAACLHRIREVCDSLEQMKTVSQIASTAVALSPGFCPSPLWRHLLLALRRDLSRVGCPVPY